MQSPNFSNFKITNLCQSVAICEAIGGDRFNWGNEEENHPAFVTYVGCASWEEAQGTMKSLMTFWRATECRIRKATRLDSAFEIKVKGLQRQTDEDAFGLDYLVQTRSLAEWCDEQYQAKEERSNLMADYFDSAWVS